jgi:hypothetical protein
MPDDGPLGSVGDVLAPVALVPGGEVTGDAAVPGDATPGFQAGGREGGGPPSDDEIEKLRLKVRKLIRKGRKSGWTLAADNLEDWLEGKYPGGTKELSGKWFEDERFIQTHLQNVHRYKIKTGAEKRLKASRETQFPPSPTTVLCGRRTVSPMPNTLRPAGPDQPGQTTIYWQDSVDAPRSNQLFYALGGFTVLSTVRLSATPVTTGSAPGWNVTIDEWTAEVCDRYNWDKGKSTTIPFMGPFDDEEMARLERHGPAEPYDIVSKPWIVTEKKITKEFSVKG